MICRLEGTSEVCILPFPVDYVDKSPLSRPFHLQAKSSGRTIQPMPSPLSFNRSRYRAVSSLDGPSDAVRASKMSGNVGFGGGAKSCQVPDPPRMLSNVIISTACVENLQHSPGLFGTPKAATFGDVVTIVHFLKQKPLVAVVFRPPGAPVYRMRASVL